MKRFKGKTVIIIGAGSGIGCATTMRFSKEGANVVLVGRIQKTLEETAQELPQDNTWIHGDNHLTITCDITNQNQVEAMVSHVVQMFERIDIVINNAGEALQNSTPDMSASDWQATTDVSLNGTAYVCQATLPELVKTQGSIINVTSLSGIGEDWDIEDYNTAKKSVRDLTHKLALKHGPDGVQVNAVEAVNTSHTTANPKKNDNSQKFLERSPLGRIATPDDIAAVITFLASTDATMITGVSLPVDGGFSVSNT